MSIQHVNAISNRLSLRPPQRDSLEILARKGIWGQVLHYNISDSYLSILTGSKSCDISDLAG